MDISIVIPAFEESKKIAFDITTASEFLIKHQLRGEIIVVDDGSKDDTATAAQKVDLPAGVHRRVIRYPNHTGKGFAVRTGMLNSRGEIVMFIDSGNCVPYQYVWQGIRMIKNGDCDIAHGSRYLPQSKMLQPHIWSRRLSSYLFRKLLNSILHIPTHLTDTQCGLKIYRGDVARLLYQECITTGFMFDIEIILRAQKHGFLIKEFPIEWTADHDSRLSQTKMMFGVFFELLRIKFRMKRE